MRKTIIAVTIYLFAFTPKFLAAQEMAKKQLGIEELFKLTVDSSQQLQVARLSVDVAAQRVEVAKIARNPNLTASASALYLGDITVYDTKLANSVIVPMPHFGNTFAVQASQVVFRGKSISNTIAIATLQQQIASLGYKKAIMDIKLIVAANYFDLLRLNNQRSVYLRNIELAKLRIGNISKMYKQGMVTRNDLIRNELLIVNLQTAVQQLDNTMAILNQQLDITLGLPANTLILPDTNILQNKPIATSLLSSLDFAFQNHPDLQLSIVGFQVAEKGIAIAKADLLPAITLTGANSLARPLTNAIPIRDNYSNSWQAGVSLSYNISSLYNSKKNINLAKTQTQQQRETVELQRQTIEINVKSAFIKHQEAQQLLASAEKSVQLAEENFRIVDRKYLNQMATLTDLLDATNARLDAQLQQKNAEISIVYTYYQLQRAIGNL